MTNPGGFSNFEPDAYERVTAYTQRFQQDLIEESEYLARRTRRRRRVTQQDVHSAWSNLRHLNQKPLLQKLASPIGGALFGFAFPALLQTLNTRTLTIETLLGIVGFLLILWDVGVLRFDGLQ